MGHISSMFSELLLSLGHHGISQLPDRDTAETWLRLPQQEGMAEPPLLSLSHLPVSAQGTRLGSAYCRYAVPALSPPSPDLAAPSQLLGLTSDLPPSCRLGCDHWVTRPTPVTVTRPALLFLLRDPRTAFFSGEGTAPPCHAITCPSAAHSCCPRCMWPLGDVEMSHA